MNFLEHSNILINNNNGNRQVYLNVNSDLGTFVYKFNKTTNKNGADRSRLKPR